MSTLAHNWVPSGRVANTGGYHQIIVTPPGGRPVDVTFVRGAPAQLGDYGSADPFGDTTCPITFPMLTIFDDLQSPELNWCTEDALVDILWVPAMPWPGPSWVPIDSETALWMNPLTNRKDLVCPSYLWAQDPSTHAWHRTGVLRAKPVWEGHVASVEVSDEDNSGSIALSCQGALLQPDLTLAKPFFPPRPQTMESLILGVYSKTRNPTLRTAAPVIEWPAGWALHAPAWTGSSNVFSPNVRPGTKWSGYTSRATGSWDKGVTSFISGMLQVMLTQPGCGLAPGLQWTLRHALRGDPKHPGGRTPVLTVRDPATAVTVSMWAGTQGLKANLTRDANQKADVIYGTGTDLAGTTWRNAVIASDGSRTDYRPLAYSKLSYPTASNPALQRGRFLRESYIQFGNGMSQVDAVAASNSTLQRDLDPGWAGTITLATDPSPTLSRWELRAGMSFVLKGFLGTGARGTRFHVAQVECSPSNGKVTLTVDTRYRDMISVQEALQRTRDALRPVRLLSNNSNSVTIEDIQAPWDYTLGAGYIPKTSRSLYHHKPTSSIFPYHSWVQAHPPRKHPSWYVMCHANHPDSRKRWAGPVAVLMSEKGTIRRSEFFCVDIDGNLVANRFHVSLYYTSGINYSFMPNNGKVWSPWLRGAFDAVNPDTGEQWVTPNLEADQGVVKLWGNYAQPAGYSPGLFTNGDKPTGLLVDENPWTFDCSANNPNYDHLAKAGKEPASVITIYAMFYTEHPSAVYFGGRLFRQEPGNDS